MSNILLYLLFPVLLMDVTMPPASVAKCRQCIILSEQLENRIAIADVPSKTIIWAWKPIAPGIRAEHYKWFSNVSDAKLVYNGEYILTVASGGGVALIRIADKKVIFYAYAGGNTHSAELFPDGNIVTASSTGNILTLFKVDFLNFPDNVYKKTLVMEDAHNVVWDHTNQVLWSASKNLLKKFRYNFDCDAPDLNLLESITLPGSGTHDLFPVYDENALWLTNSAQVYKFNIASKTLVEASEVPIHTDIKSVSSGPAGFPVIIIKPKTKWWTDEVKDAAGNGIFYKAGLKIYKARWLLNNSFSYPAGDKIKQCE